MTKGGRGGRRPNQTGRPPKDNTLIQTSVSLTRAQVDKLKRLAAQRDSTIAGIVRDAVDALPEEKTT
jgi:hypothetical protein